MQGFRLYQLPEIYRLIDEAVEKSDGEMTPEIEALAQVAGETLETKADHYASLIREAEAVAVAAFDEMILFRERARLARAKAATYRTLVVDAMTAAGKSELKGKRFNLATVLHSIPSIRWTKNTADIPEITYELNGKTVTDTPITYSVVLDGHLSHVILKANGELPEGFEVKYTTRLTIK